MFFENVDFVKIVLPPRRRAYFQGSEPPKNDPKSMPTHSKKNSKKNIPKIDVGFHFGLPKPPKIDPTSKKIGKKRVPKNVLKKESCKSPQLAAPHRKSRLLGSQ